MESEQIGMWAIGILGVLGTLLAAVIPILYNRWSVKPGQQLKCAYIKAVHLSRRRDGSPPAYKRLIKRLNKEVDVYDEFLLMRLEIFNRKQPSYSSSDRSSGAVDLQVLYPWQQDLEFSDRGAKAVAGVVAPTIPTASNTYYTAAEYFNCFQEGNEDFGIKMTQHTSEARLIVDFSSIEGFEKVIKSMPVGYLSCVGGQNKLIVEELNRGVYMLAWKNLQKDEVLRIDFSIDWDKVDQLNAAMERARA